MSRWVPSTTPGAILAAASWAAWMMAPAFSRACRTSSSYTARASLVIWRLNSSASAGRGGVALPESEQLQEQVAYLKAFGQACRTQLRSYLEALLSDVETEWGRAHPAALPPVPVGVRPQQLERGTGPATAMSFHGNAATDGLDDPAGATVATVPATRVPS